MPLGRETTAPVDWLWLLCLPGQPVGVQVVLSEQRCKLGILAAAVPGADGLLLGSMDSSVSNMRLC